MRIEPRSLAAMPWYLRPFFWHQRRRYGRALDAARLWARSPRLFLALLLFRGALERRASPLPPALRALVMVRISQLNHCPFCVDLNAATLLGHGVAEAKLLALADWRASDLFEPGERDALAFAEAITLSDRQVDDRLIAALRRHLDDDAVIELTALIAFQNLSSKFNAALDVPAQGFCRIPTADAADATDVDPNADGSRQSESGPPSPAGG
jgi:AhpD family alkylhydroperoxidase